MTTGTQPTATLDSAGSPRSAHADPAARRRSKRWVLVAVTLLVAGALVNGYLAWKDDGPATEVDGVEYIAGLTDAVVTGQITYDRHPPAGGAHALETQACGLYRVPIQDQYAVASLATGAVWIAYRPDLSGDEVETLRDVAEGERDVILAPYPGLDAPVVLTAWGVQLRLDSVDDERVPLFIAVYGNRDEAPNPDGNCASGMGLP